MKSAACPKMWPGISYLQNNWTTKIPKSYGAIFRKYGDDHRYLKTRWRTTGFYGGTAICLWQP